MADYLPVYTPGEAVSMTASAAITGGQLVAVSGNGTVGPAGASSGAVVGVAGHNAASGSRVTVYARGVVHETVADGAITAGNQVVSAAAGAVSALAAMATGAADEGDVNAARAVLGVALTTAADEALVRWMAW